MTTVYVTKHALTDGIQVAETNSGTDYPVIRVEHEGFAGTFFQQGEWHTNWKRPWSGPK